jgi:hypothetical protein
VSDEIALFLCDDRDFAALGLDLLHRGKAIRFRASGSSMEPFILDGDLLVVHPLASRVRRGDVLLYQSSGGKVLAHRVVRRARDGARLLARGDAVRWQNEDWIDVGSVLGRVVSLERDGRVIETASRGRRWAGLAYGFMADLWHRVRRIAPRCRSLAACFFRLNGQGGSS